MKTEYGVKNLITGKIIREGMSEGQVDSLLRVHEAILEEEAVEESIRKKKEVKRKETYLIKIKRTISDWS